MSDAAKVQPPISLTAAEARTVLKANRANLPKHTAALLRKVANNKPLTDRERGLLEGVIVNSMRRQPQTGRAARGAELSFAVAARRRRVLEAQLRYPAPTIREIAEELGVDKNTILRDLKALKSEFEQFQPQENRALLAQTLAQHDLLIGQNAALAQHFTAPSAKAAFLRNAQAALADKTRLMESVGVVRVIPRRIEASGPDGGAIPMESTAKIVIMPALEDSKQ